MALHSVWRDSGVTQQHGFELVVDVCGFPRGDEPPIGMRDRAPLLLDGRYECISGLHLPGLPVIRHATTTALTWRAIPP
jgi:hypothetical protein